MRLCESNHIPPDLKPVCLYFIIPWDNIELALVVKQHFVALYFSQQNHIDSKNGIVLQFQMST